MSQSRRDFLKQTGIISAGLLVLPIAGQAQADLFAAAESGAFAIHQGLTLEDLTYISVLRQITDEISFEVVDSNNRLQKFLLLSEHRMQGSDLQLDKLKVINLRLGESYRFRILDSKRRVIDERFFKTLDTNKKMPKIVVASCMNEFFKSACVKMWASLKETNPDVIFLIGDTCYADLKNDGSPLGYWKRYTTVRNSIGIFRHKNLTPILAAWDDHDYAQDGADGSFLQKQFTLELFSTFWLHPEERNYHRGLGVSQDITLFGQKFYLTDCRYYRSDESHFGDEQEEKLIADLQKDTMPVWLMNGSQFFGGYLKEDAFEYKQPKNFKEFCKKLKSVDAPLCFVSGDIHYSELMEIDPEVLGYKTFEITSSSIHSLTILQQHNFKKNPRRIKKCASSKHNFNVITIDNSSDQFKFSVSCQGDERKPYYQKSLEIIR